MVDPQKQPPVVEFSTTQGPALWHSDKCLNDVRRYGFCEHEMLPLKRVKRPPPPRWRERHPVLKELIAAGLFAGLIGCYIPVYLQMGWVGFAVFSLAGIGWMGLLIWGIPKFLQQDLRDLLPRDPK